MFCMDFWVMTWYVLSLGESCSLLFLALSHTVGKFCSNVAVHIFFAPVFYFHLEEPLVVTLNNESIFP